MYLNRLHVTSWGIENSYVNDCRTFPPPDIPTPSDVQGMTLKCIHIFIVTGSFLYVMRPASQRFFIHTYFYLSTNNDHILFSNVSWH